MTEDALLAQMPALRESALLSEAVMRICKLRDNVRSDGPTESMCFRMVAVLVQLSQDDIGLRVSCLADRCGMGSKAVRIAITKLLTLGYVKAKRVGIKINEYTITPAGLAYLEART
jgi:hypothetical protein